MILRVVLLTSTERSCPIRCLWEHSRPSLSNHLLFLPWVLEWLFWTEVAPLSLLPNQVKSSLASELLFKTFSEWWKEVLCCWMPISCLGQRLQFSFSLFLNKKNPVSLKKEFLLFSVNLPVALSGGAITFQYFFLQLNFTLCISFYQTFMLLLCSQNGHRSLHHRDFHPWTAHV